MPPLSSRRPNPTQSSPTVTRWHILPAAAALLALAGGVSASNKVLCHPYADPGGPYLAECSGSPVNLVVDGSGSDSCPGDPITFEWTTDCPGGNFDDPTAMSPTLALNSPPPCPVECGVTLRVSNSIGLSISRSATVTIADTLPPTVTSATAPLSCLWPANGRMVCFTTNDFAPIIADACSATVSWRFADCSADEPSAVPADCVIDPDGGRVCARAARDRRGVGRNYAVSIVAEDDCANLSGPTVIGNLLVPRKPSAACSPTSSNGVSFAPTVRLR